MTWCEECTKAGAPKRSVLTVLAYGVLARAVRPSPAAQMIAAQGQLMAAMLGAAAAGPSPYERHRAEYERTGDLLELERALRHPLPPVPVHRHQPARRWRLTFDQGAMMAMGALIVTLLLVLFL